MRIFDAVVCGEGEEVLVEIQYFYLSSVYSQPLLVSFVIPPVVVARLALPIS
jgi:hypothetical protein